MAKATINPDVCKSCELCIAACPKQIIGLDKSTMNAKGYHPAKVIEPDKCIGCCACAIMCPDCAITVER